MFQSLKFFFMSSLCVGLFLSASLPDSALAATYRVGIAPSLPEPVDDIDDIDFETEEDKIKRGLKVKRKEEPQIPIKPTQMQSLNLPTKYEAWEKVLALLSKKTGIDLKLTPAKSQLSFELGLAKGAYDFAYITPLQFVAFNDHPGYKAMVKRKAQPIRGIIFTNKSGPYRSLTQLREAEIAFSPPLNFESSVAVRSSLEKLKFGFTPSFLASQDLVYQQVALNKYKAGSGTHETLKAQPLEIRQKLMIVWDSPGYSPYPFVSHPRIPFFTLTKLKRAMVNLSRDPEARTLLKHIFVSNGFETAKDSDWHEISQIDIEKLNGQPAKIQAPEPRMGQ